MLKKLFKGNKVETNASNKEVKEYIKALNRFDEAVNEIDRITEKMFQQNDIELKRLQRIPF